MKKIAFIGTLALILFSSAAIADDIEIGATPIAGSWTQNWSENGHFEDGFVPYNQVVITMGSGASLLSLTAVTENWNVSGGTLTYMGPSGAQIGQLDFVATYSGDQSSALSFTYEVFLSDVLLCHQVVDWNPDSATWSFQFPNNCLEPAPVPEAGASMLLLLGLASPILVSTFAGRFKSRRSQCR